MKNITLQLFEYLLAAQNSNLSVSYSLNKYPSYWFLDEVLSFDNIQLENVNEGKARVKLQRSNVSDQEINMSMGLSTILNLIQYNNTGSDQLLISKDELENNLLLEAEIVKRKLENKSKGVILINDWQQLLLGVDQAQILVEEAKQENLETFIEEVLAEYEEWQVALKQRNLEKERLLKEQEIFDYILTLNNNTDNTNKINLGIGVLYMPDEPSIYHPLLTLDLEIVVDSSETNIELIFADQSLQVDDILDHVLFYNLDVVKQVRLFTSEMKVSPFDDNIVATILQKIIKHIHPDGRYLSSPADAALAPKGVPQVLHRSVLFVRGERPHSEGVDKLKLISEYLSNNNIPSDVIGSIVDPNYISQSKHTPYKISGLDPFFIWATDGVEKQMVNLLDQNNAVAVFEEEKVDSSFIVANLITHLMATGKRVLVVGEDDLILDKIREAIPPYLSGLHSKLSAEETGLQKLKHDLAHLLEKKDYYKLPNLETDKISDEIGQINSKLNGIARRVVDYRELGSKKVFWKDKRYYPYELAQLILKLGGRNYLNGDNVPLDVRFDMKDSEIGKLWELRPDFTPENMSLLNYDFIDIDELTNYTEYQKMLVAEEKYLQLVREDANLEEMFDNTIDIRFVQYLYDQLPKLMKDISEIKTSYGERILKKALSDLGNYHALASSLDRINRGIEDIEFLDGSKERRDALIQRLNEMLDIELSDLPILYNIDLNQLAEFYSVKRAEMTSALRAAHLILIFNEGAMALSGNFKGISAAGINTMNILYKAAALRLSKVEFEVYWSRVKSYFIRVYQPIIQQEHIHPACIDMYEALVNDHLSEFREVLEEIGNLTRARQNFVIFGKFINQIGEMMPKFTTSIMSDQNIDVATPPDFKEAFDQGKLNGLFEQLHMYESEFLEQEVEELKEFQLKLQHEMLEKESWKTMHFVSESVLLETIALLERGSFSNDDEANKMNDLDEVIDNVLSIFPALFMPLRENEIIKKFDPDLFDLVIFVNASSANIMRITELIHAHKAILFGKESTHINSPLNIRQKDLQMLLSTYGEALQSFGKQYFEASLFNLVANSAAWDAQVKLPKSATQVSIKNIGKNIKSGAEKCETPIENEIFEDLVKIGYDVKCKIKIGKVMLDFLIIGESNNLAVNVVGDIQLQREAIKTQIEHEMELRRKGLNIRTIQAVHYYLDSRKTLMDLCDDLERLEIFPVKKNAEAQGA